MHIPYTAVMGNESEPNTPVVIKVEPIGLNVLRKEYRRSGRIGINPENPEVEFGEQSRLWTSGFARKLGFSTSKAYIETLPKEFGPKPESFTNLSPPADPILVDPRAIGLPDFLDIVRIYSFFDLSELKDWLEGGHKTPTEPYTTWVTYIPNKSVKEVRHNLDKDQRGGTLLDVIALCIANPWIFNRYSLQLPGNQVSSDYVPFLWAPSNSEENQAPNNFFLDYGVTDSGSGKFASVIASRV